MVSPLVEVQFTLSVVYNLHLMGIGLGDPGVEFGEDVGSDGAKDLLVVFDRPTVIVDVGKHDIGATLVDVGGDLVAGNGV